MCSIIPCDIGHLNKGNNNINELRTILQRESRSTHFEINCQSLYISYTSKKCLFENWIFKKKYSGYL
jgi:hypothetical protein